MMEKMLLKKKDMKMKKTAGRGVLAMTLPTVIFLLMECYTHNPLLEVRPYAIGFNGLLFLFFAWILIFVTGRPGASLATESVAAMLFGLTNAYVVRFRGTPIVPWDIFSLRTAVSVADNYNYTPSIRMINVTVLFCCLFVGIFFVYRGSRLSIPIWKRMFPAAILLMVLFFFIGKVQQESFQNRHRLYNKLFTPTYMTNADGIALTFVMNLRYLSIEKPKGYSAKEAERILESHESSVAADGEELPNLIVIMNESFADLSVLGEFSTNRDPISFLHGLQQGAKNTVTGTLNVSVCGGNTADTEFEFLTGNTMAFLPQGSIPYQQYINGEIPAVPRVLAELGYRTVAAHPYNASGWERNRVYPLLGFEECLFSGAFPQTGKIRNYVSDEECTNFIIRQYERKEVKTPLFLFLVTMQNHGGYQELYENFTPEITVDGLDNIAVSQYLSLTERSEHALWKLISYFKEKEEKTVVVFFGDHQPGDTVAVPILQVSGKNPSDLSAEDFICRYQVPYVIWANYEIGAENGADTSVNYLAAEVFARAGIPTDAYADFLLTLKEQCPILSAVRTVRAGNVTETLEDDLLLYQKLQYYRLFDHGGLE